MLQTIFYGLTIGGILYIISIGLSLTFGAMGIVNFSHGLIYAIGAYTIYALMSKMGVSFFLGTIVAILVSIPFSYVIEKYLIRKLYGESIDYAIIATYAVLLIGVDAIKWIWGANPLPISDPIGTSVVFLSMEMPLYRLIIIGLTFLILGGLSLFFKKTIIGKIIIAGLSDQEAVRGLGIKLDKYFAIIFILGSSLAALGGVLYSPISTLHPYMGFNILILCFAVVIVGGMGNLRGTAIAAFALGLVMAITGRFWGPAAEAMVYMVMAVVLMVRPIET